MSFLFLLGVMALNYRTLNAVIPFLGDEGFHIDRTLVLVTTIPLKWTFGVLFLFVLLMYLALKKSRWTIIIGIIIVGTVILLFLNQNPFDEIKQPIFFLRYPFINYWLFGLVPKLASLFINPYHEILYRILPVLSMGILAWAIQKHTAIAETSLTFGLAFDIVTIPIVFYYSSILYIEPLAILLMTIVCLGMNNLIEENRKKLTQNPSWYALILIGFIKETTLPFLLCFFACREAIQLRKWFSTKQGKNSKKFLANFVAGELGIVFAALAPVFLYLYFRANVTATRTYIPYVLNLFDLSLYPLLGRSLMEQFGLFLLFFLCGCSILTARKEYTTLFCHISLIAATLAFYIMDNKLLIGYSRFNLYILPSILTVANVFIQWLFLQKRAFGILLVVSTLLVNLLVSPVYLDGTKKPYWGNYLIDTSEHYYPYQDAFLWIKNRHKNGRILFTGVDYQYSFQFYWNKLDWYPRREGTATENTDNETVAITKILDKADKEGFDFVVYRVLGRSFVLPKDTRGFQVETIRNEAHTLIVFYRKT
jgi:hypothetical protein